MIFKDQNVKSGILEALGEGIKNTKWLIRFEALMYGATVEEKDEEAVK